MKKILLLNFPGKQLYIRDYYCSKVSKADYYNAPIDLVMLSGVLNTGEFELKLIDAIVDKLSPEETTQQIQEFAPDHIIGLIASVSLPEDKVFLAGLLDAGYDVLLSGDLLLTEGQKFLEEFPKLHGVITSFISAGVLAYFRGQKDQIQDMIVREEQGIIVYPKAIGFAFDINLPIHEQFITKNYRMPFVHRYPFATTLMTNGCTYRCTFCIMNTFKYRERPLDNIIAELDRLEELGVKEVLFLDQTLGINKKNFRRLLEIMVEKQYGFSWFGFSRVDVMNPEIMELAKKAGCHTIWFGIESGSQHILDTYKKDYELSQIAATFDAARKAGIKTLATFLIGLPEETYEMAQATIRFAIKINPDYASFNFAVPRFGTGLRDEALKDHLIDASFDTMDQSGSEIAMNSKHMTREQIKSLQKEAIFRFYLRPSYIIHRFASIRSFTEFRENINNAYNLLKNTFFA